MGRIRVLPDQVANQIAAGEVVDRPASVVKELLENALDAGARRIRIEVEAGGRKLIRIADDGHGMNRDDALLAFERHATSKLRTADDLLSIATLGFRGEALPSIASVARVLLETREPGSAAGTRVEIAGGKILTVEDAAVPEGTSITIQDLFFNTPARRKFLRAESTELSHVTALVTHYALVHPEKHFELISASHTLLQAPPVNRASERIYQIFGADTLEQLLPVAAELPLERAGLPEPPPWKIDPDEPKREPGSLRLSGFYSKPELQKLNRNSIYIFVNKRLIRDRLLLHAISEAYRNIIPPTSFPVVLLFLDMPPEEVDVNVHPAKTEVRFRQQNVVHDFVRDSLRNALMAARPAASFVAALDNGPLASPSLIPSPASRLPQADEVPEQAAQIQPLMPDGPMPGVHEPVFQLMPLMPPPAPGKLPFGVETDDGFGPESTVENWSQAAVSMLNPLTNQALAASLPIRMPEEELNQAVAQGTAGTELLRDQTNLNQLAGLKPLGQLRDSFIVAVDDDGLWIIDQHVAHERILFEKILASRDVEAIQRQRMLMPLLVDLQPWQMTVFAEIADELDKNGFEAEPFGPRTLAVKAAPVGLEGGELERMLMEVIESVGGSGPVGGRSQDLGTLRGKIAASIACHSAIKVNTPLESQKMDWLLKELSKTRFPTSCPHGRPIALRYSWKEIQRAFQRI
ncbi:DNA mismatch repair endonuclease MutL [Acidicapsa dinghuensis]|uniref:DNA mismatch repair protein MutL n=1 Tax=Acidicapsa dinghuensis TaxID=2218256 RepID=A0ABW1EDC8_9BACT|nr:DNA mismatch repair endonuclease MutL [Acidicapsa dinghuensis]